MKNTAPALITNPIKDIQTTTRGYENIKPALNIKAIAQKIDKTTW
jgi:hypothetical protein